MTDIKKLSNTQLGAVLTQIPALEAFIKAVKLEAMRVLSHDPAAFPSHKIVEGKSRRQWRDRAHTMKVLAAAAKKMGFTIDDYAPRDLLGLGEITKLLPPGKREPFLAKHTTKPRGKAALAPSSDPRPAINGNALVDFAEDIEDRED